MAKYRQRFAAARPQERDLAVYRLDRVPTLDETKQRAVAEQRLILLVVVTNSYGNVFTGHCCGNATPVRAGHVSNPSTVELLRPFLVVAWHGANETAMPAEIREIFRKSDLAKDTNVFLFALDQIGGLVSGFRGVGGPHCGQPTFNEQIPAATVRPWLVHLYPRAIRAADQAKPFRQITGMLAREPAGADEKFEFSVLRGPVRMTKERGELAETESAFEGTVAGVIA